MLLVPVVVHAVLASHGAAPHGWVSLKAAQAIGAAQVAGLAWLATGVAELARRWRGLLALLASAGFLLAASAEPQDSLVAVAGLSHAALYLGLALLFGGSLRPGREALVSRLARRVEPCPTPALLAYTRGVTWLWAGFGVAQLTGSALLLAAAPLAVWSGFVNLLDAPLVGLTFAAEYAVRRWRFRHARLASLADTVRAFARPDPRSEAQSGGSAWSTSR